MLADRYDNKKLIVKNHVKAIFDMPVMGKKSYSGLCKIVDGTQMHIRALRAFKRSVDIWDDMLIELISCKLDYSTSKE